MENTELPDRVVSLAKSIRFCGIIDKLGEIVEGKYRDNFRHLMTDEQERKLFLVAAVRNLSRKQWDSTLGSLRYSIARYQKVIVVTIPLWEDHLIFVTFDHDEQDYDVILRKKVIPLLAKYESLL